MASWRKYKYLRYYQGIFSQQPLLLQPIELDRTQPLTKTPPKMLHELPLELKQNICQFLGEDYSSLNAFSQISLSCHSPGESYLYRHIDFGSHDARKANKLLLTLLRRPELAKHIRSINLSKDYEWYNGDRGKKMSEEFLSAFGMNLDKAEKYVDEIIESNKSLFLRYQWLSGLMKPYSNLDSSMAMILYLASCNLESIEIYERKGESEPEFDEQFEEKENLRVQTLDFLLKGPFVPTGPHNQREQDNVAEDEAAKTMAMSKLLHLTVRDCKFLDCAYLPALKTLRIHKDIAVSALNLGKPNLPNLRTLEFRDVLFESFCLADFLSTAGLKRLTKLSIVKAVYHENTDFLALVNAIETHAPNLEHLEWTHVETRPGCELLQIDVLTQLNLKVLHLDWALLSGKSDPDHLFFLDEEPFLPVGLKELHISNLEYENLSHVLSKANQKTAASQMKNIAYAYGIPTLSVTTRIPQHHWNHMSPDDMKTRLQKISDTMLVAGTSFLVLVEENASWRGPAPSRPWILPKEVKVKAIASPVEQMIGNLQI